MFACMLLLFVWMGVGFGVTAQAASLCQLPSTVDAFIEERKEGTASISLGIFKDGDVLYQKQYGFIDIENQIPATDDVIYEWGSVSKVLVWISLMQLEESGHIDLNEDVKTYLPADFAEKLN